MDITISCCDGNVVCDRDTIIQHSNILSKHFSEVEVCSCNCDVIIPDLNIDLVRLAISLLERGKSDVVELAKDLHETVALVYSLLQIDCVSTWKESFLNPDTVYIQEMESYSSVWTCPSCNHSFNSRSRLHFCSKLLEIFLCRILELLRKINYKIAIVKFRTI